LFAVVNYGLLLFDFFRVSSKTFCSNFIPHANDKMQKLSIVKCQ